MQLEEFLCIKLIWACLLCSVWCLESVFLTYTLIILIRLSGRNMEQQAQQEQFDSVVLTNKKITQLINVSYEAPATARILLFLLESLENNDSVVLDTDRIQSSLGIKSKTTLQVAFKYLISKNLITRKKIGGGQYLYKVTWGSQ